MCGIFAAFALGAKQLDFVSSSFYERASLLMESRGPDHFGHYLSGDGRALITHSRLVIQGLDSYANQPYTCKDGSILAYNGELYNARHLGHSDFSGRTSSDTPIFGELVSEGHIPISDLDGMFSFVLYNAEKKVIRAGRDIYGEKPLFMYKAESLVFFFSQLSYLSLLPLFGVSKPEVDLSFINRLLLYGYRKALGQNKNISCMVGVEMIKTGTTVRIDQERATFDEECFYSIRDQFVNKTADSRFDQNIGYALLATSIGLRNASDVNTAVCLSGGVDSSLVTTLLCHTDNPPSLALTLHSNDDRYNESAVAAQTAKNLGIPHRLVCINDTSSSQSPVSRFIELSKHRGSPFLTLTSFVSTYLYSECNSAGCRVLYSGLGGDELFSGYYDYYFYRMLATDYGSSEAHAFSTHVLPFLRNPVLKKGTNALSEIRSLSHHYFDSEMRSSFFKHEAPRTEHSLEKTAGVSYLRSRMCEDLTTEVVPVILYEDDLNAMYYSVENRSPLLSRQVLEYALSLPDSCLMVDGYQKFPLRQFLEKAGSASHIASSRRKIGFNFSIDEFIQTDSSLVKGTMQLDSILWEVIDRTKASRAVLDHSLSDSFRFMIFSLQCFLSSLN